VSSHKENVPTQAGFKRKSKPIVKRRGGFTAVELLVTISIAAILAVVAIPSFVGTLNRNRLTTESNNLVADLVPARSEAMSRGATVSVCQSSDGTSCTTTGWGSGRIVFLDAGPAGQVDAGDTVLKVSAPIAGGDTMTASFAGNFVQYTADGSLSTPGTYTTCHTGYVGLNVVIARLGRVSTKKAAVCP
jgi:type IV fimbrial biogenesis protein FimT